jgi:hypothetical protein
MVSLRLALSFLLLASTARAGARMGLGAPAALLAKLEAEETRLTRTYTFLTSAGEPIAAQVEGYYYQDGRFSMSGRARESANSRFILKGDAAGLYGWLVLKDRNVAYEYATDPVSGILTVAEVSVDSIYGICGVQDASGTAVLQGPQPAPPPSPPAPDAEPHLGSYPGIPAGKFQSRPGAPKVLFWDLRDAPDIWTPEEFWRAWQAWASMYSMFDVNLTTDSAVYAATAVPDRGRLHQSATPGVSSCGVNIFGTDVACNILKREMPEIQGGTLAHETGHMLGLSHDGAVGADGAVIAYTLGFPFFHWTVLMGVHNVCYGSPECLVQFSKGEYKWANQKQDDFEIIRKHLEFRNKPRTGPVPLKLMENVVAAADNRGQIVRATDVDTFAFRLAAGGGRVRLKASRIGPIYGSMLDIDASVLDADGKVMGQSNKSQARDAEFDLDLPAGSYYLTIRGGAEGTPEYGFSNYSSLGFYAIEGAITGAVPTQAGDPRGPKAPERWAKRNPPGAETRFVDGRLRLRLPNGARLEVDGSRMRFSGGE